MELETIHIFTGISLILLGIVIKYGKAYNLIAGYNTMSKEAKKAYNIEAFAGLLGNALFLIGTLIIAGFYLVDYMGWLDFIPLVVLLPVICIIPVVIVKGKKYGKEKK